jgi:predicted nucleic acid-binding Zn ribbon protein
MHSTFTNQRRLADAIVREILSERIPPQPTAACLICGRKLARGGARFCSSRCREAFDAGFPAFDPDYASKSNPRWYSLPIGAQGFYIACVGCGRRFDSKGLRCCSIECERKHRCKQELDTELKDDPFRVVKRKCDECRGDIPNWRNGRRVSKAARFCSDRCAASARRKSAVLEGNDQNPVLSPETAKKCPKNGDFSRIDSRPIPLPKAADSATVVASQWRPCANPTENFPGIPEFLCRGAPAEPAS